jgi:hypothetical protein
MPPAGAKLTRRATAWLERATAMASIGGESVFRRGPQKRRLVAHGLGRRMRQRRLALAIRRRFLLGSSDLLLIHLPFPFAPPVVFASKRGTDVAPTFRPPIAHGLRLSPSGGLLAGRSCAFPVRVALLLK